MGDYACNCGMTTCVLCVGYEAAEWDAYYDRDNQPTPQREVSFCVDELTAKDREFLRSLRIGWGK